MPKLPKIRFSTHAKLRIVERWVDADNVKRAIDKPDRKKLIEDAWKVWKEINGKTVVVVYKDYLNINNKVEYFIITFYYLKKKL